MDAVDNTVGQVAEGKILRFDPIEAIKPEELKTFLHDSPHQFIKTVTHEFSAVCPFSGLPDLATVVIEYYPAVKKAVELKSLKYYMLSYRNVGIYQEGVTKKIYEDMYRALGFGEPTEGSVAPLRVTTHYHVRGGFYTTCVEGFLSSTPSISYPENF